MGEQPGSMYREVNSQAYTRKEYIDGVPGLRLTQFELGNKQGDFDAVLHLKAGEKCQIRHGALEAARVAANRALVKNCGSLGYHIKVRVYPHHVVRHNKQAAGAGADRISSGMRNSFGKPVGAAARIDVGQPIITVRTHWQFYDVAKESLRRAYMKLPIPCDREVKGEVPKNIEEMMKGATAIGSTELEEEEEEEELEEEEAEEAEVLEEAEDEEAEADDAEEEGEEGPHETEHSL
jgi:large subunit ribosomal protein L10e